MAKREGGYHLPKPKPPKRPPRYLFLDAVRALDCGDDARVRATLLRMKPEEVDYLLQLAVRLEGFCREHIRTKGG